MNDFIFPVPKNPEPSFIHLDLFLNVFSAIEGEPQIQLERNDLWVRGGALTKSKNIRAAYEFLAVKGVLYLRLAIPFSRDELLPMRNPKAQVRINDLLDRFLRNLIPEAKLASVLVGNIGEVVRTDLKEESLHPLMKTFLTYVQQSASGTGRAGSEDVVIMADYENGTSDVEMEFWGGVTYSQEKTKEVETPALDLAEACRGGACNMRGLIRSLAKIADAPGFDGQSIEIRYVLGHLAFLSGDSLGPSEETTAKLEELINAHEARKKEHP